MAIFWNTIPAPKILFKSPKLIGQKLLLYGHLLKDIFERANLSDVAWQNFMLKKT